MKSLLKIVLNLLLLVWSLGYFYFFTITHRYILDNTTTTEAIVVFAGTKQKLYTGAQLVKYGYSPLLFVTSDRPMSYYEPFLDSAGISKEGFIFDNEFAKGYNDYGRETALFVLKYKLESIRVVANAEELVRAVIDIKSKLPSYITVIPHPVSQKKDNHIKILIEYHKFIITYFASIIGQAHKLNIPYS